MGILFEYELRYLQYSITTTNVPLRTMGCAATKAIETVEAKKDEGVDEAQDYVQTTAESLANDAHNFTYQGNNTERKSTALCSPLVYRELCGSSFDFEKTQLYTPKTFVSFCFMN